MDLLYEYKYPLLLLLFILTIVIYKFKDKIFGFIKNPGFKSGMNPKIPRVIYQTYKDKNIPPIVKERWLKLNPGFEYKLYDNKDCYNFILNNYGQKYAKFFNFIKDGPIKSDFWRVCILYQYGGVYADIDIIPKVPIDQFVNSDTTFYTCVTPPKLDNNLNPHFIAVEPKNPLILECINVYMKDRFYRKYDYQIYSITHIMFMVLQKYLNKYTFEENTYQKDNQVIQFSQEICKSNDITQCYIQQKDQIIMYTRDSEIYDEKNHTFK